MVQPQGAFSEGAVWGFQGCSISGRFCSSSVLIIGSLMATMELSLPDTEIAQVAQAGRELSSPSLQHLDAQFQSWAHSVGRDRRIKRSD